MTSKKENTKDDLGLSGFLKTYKFSGLKKHTILTVVCSLIYLFALLKSGENFKSQLDTILELGLNILPNLLGFLLGGYAIMISFGSTKFIKIVTQIDEDQEVSLFQQTSLNFTMSILVNCISLFAVFMIKIISDLQFIFPLIKEMNDLILAINFVILFLIIFLILFSIVLLPQLLFNIYNFATVYGIIMREEDDN